MYKTTLLVACAVLALTASLASAALITVDGDLSDAAWSSSGVVVYNDGNDPAILDKYDIAFTRYLWDANAGIAFFNMETYAPLGQTPTSNFVRLMIDADNDVDTGTEFYETAGSDYYFSFSLDFDNTPLTYGSQFGFYEWNANLNDWDLISNDDNLFSVSRGSAFGGYGVEWGIYGEAFGSPDEFTYGIFLDDGGTAADDYVCGQTGRIPEPGTIALLVFGLSGLYMKRRRG